MSCATLATVALDLGGRARLADPAWLHAAWLAPAILLLALVAARARRRALRRLAEAPLIAGIARASGPGRHWLRALLLAAGAALVALALAHPQAGTGTREVEQRGRDLVFVVDVSRSMLARDLAPSRLERTKLWINDLIDDLSGDRVGLVAFAGAPSVKVPLTQDRAFFRLALDGLNPDSAPRGGTNIGDAIRKVLEDVFEVEDEEGNPVESGRFRDIILFTDGEDQESFPVQAAKLAGEHGVRVIAIGVGDSGEGAPVPVEGATDSYLSYQGEIVRSRLETRTLRDIQTAVPGNVFLEVGTGEIDLAQVYRDLIATAEQTLLGSATVTAYESRFYVFLALGAALIALEALVGEGRRRA